MKKMISKVVFLCLLFVFIGSGVKLFQNLREDFQSYQMMEQIDQDKQMLVEEDYDFTELMKTNEETIGWISIPGTSIDYPLVQAKDNSYYLTHDFNHEKSKQGSIFMDYRNSLDFLDNHTIIYGHNMKNGTMFHELNKYVSQDFFNEHAYIETYSPNGYRKWCVFSTYSTGSDFNYLQIVFDSREVYSSFLNTILSKSEFYSEDIQVTAEDRILTLSTCSNDYENGRRVVHAKLVEEVIDDE